MTRKASGAGAGGLEQRVTVQRPEVDVDDSGEASVVRWIEVATVWAEIKPLSGREWLASAEFRPGVTTRIRIRWLEGVNASMRVLHGATVYGIDAILPHYLGRPEILLMCGDGVVTEGGQP